VILCDALTYAERFKPAVVVDVATLTGACVVALGHHHSGLFTADDKVAAQMLDASSKGLDPCWRMPLDEEYDEGLKSNFADMGNIGGRAGWCNHGGHVSAPLHRQVPVGPSGCRRHRVEVRSRKRRNGPTSGLAHALRAGAGGVIQRAERRAAVGHEGATGGPWPARATSGAGRSTRGAGGLY